MPHQNKKNLIDRKKRIETIESLLYHFRRGADHENRIISVFLFLKDIHPTVSQVAIVRLTAIVILEDDDQKDDCHSRVGAVGLPEESISQSKMRRSTHSVTLFSVVLLLARNGYVPM